MRDNTIDDRQAYVHSMRTLAAEYEQLADQFRIAEGDGPLSKAELYADMARSLRYEVQLITGGTNQ